MTVFINVYRKKNGGYWYGMPVSYRYWPNSNLKRALVYRIKVTFK